MVIEDEMCPGHIWQVGGDVAAGNRDLAVLHVFWMDESDFVDEVQLLEQHAADEAVEVAAGDEAVARGRHGCSPGFDLRGRLAALR
ncbi:hypothetical protein [Jiella pelagia]|uniref:Uncharacterized protein n=1 Tax=Jiella pelagia TaxID=2986949 RepID=A0ABY7BYA7_9HYPH|nr:hypothetical protein [Jiella pelagia]WAP67759.1 hypothetical protein OH818_20135 [Jiella pelagia]